MPTRDVAAAANAEVASFDRVEVDTGARRFATQGLGYASVRTAGLIDALKRIATDDGCEFHYCAPDAIAAELGGADLVVVADPAAARLDARRASDRGDARHATSLLPSNRPSRGTP